MVDGCRLLGDCLESSGLDIQQFGNVETDSSGGSLAFRRQILQEFRMSILQEVVELRKTPTITNCNL